jgi:L-alanine-DL-glutamate epimerase-like enolase superfamily enzyme
MAIKLAKIDVFPAPIPMTGAFAISSGTIAEKGAVAIHIFVRATADDGTIGWGECRPIALWSYETAHTVVTSLRHYIVPALIGHDPFDVAGLHAKMNHAIAWGTSTGQPIAKSGVDIAVHDLIAKKLGVPLWRLLGGTKRDVNLSWTLTAKSPQDVGDDIKKARKLGYQHFNYKVGNDPERDVAMGREIRKIVGPKPYVWADANGAYDLPTAMAVANRLAEAGVNVLEQPIRPGDYVGLRRLCAHSDLPIAVDEGLVSPADLLQMLELDGIDVVVGKVTRSGGLWPSRHIYDIGRAAGLPLLLSGLTDATCTLVVASCLAAAYGIDAPCALNGPQFLDDWTCAGESPLKGGKVILSDRPGHGVRLDEARIEREAAALPL